MGQIPFGDRCMMGELRYTLHIQRKHGKALAQPESKAGVYMETHNRICFAWISEGMPATKPLHDCNIALHPNGVSVSGVERDGDTYHYQEWWLSPAQMDASSVVPQPAVTEAVTPPPQPESTPEPIAEPEPIPEPEPELEPEPEPEPEPKAKESVGDAMGAVGRAMAALKATMPDDDDDMMGDEDEDEIDDDLDAEVDDEDEPMEGGLGSFDDLATLSDSELEALADEPSEGDIDDEIDLDAIDNVLDSALEEVLSAPTGEDIRGESEAPLSDDDDDEDGLTIAEQELATEADAIADVSLEEIEPEENEMFGMDDDTEVDETVLDDMLAENNNEEEEEK